MNLNLDKKLFLITGASADSAIGLALCKQLDSAGANLILVGRRQPELIATQNLLRKGKHHVEPFDLTALDDIISWMDTLTKTYGPLSGLVHSASFQGYSPLKTLNAKQINDYFTINCSAALMLAAAFAKTKNHQENSSIVFVGSVAGFKGLKARSLYAASKAALYSVTQSCALELADKKIRVNYVAPALVEGAKADKQFAMIGETEANLLKKEHPLGLSSPEDVAHSIHFLLSDMSKNITGSHIAVDGGFLAK